MKGDNLLLWNKQKLNIDVNEASFKLDVINGVKRVPLF